ncbi:MAG: response regulator [Verrucomicrobia bacterium]|nr:response regulator [Verrucomicrobiota bacterium]
MTHVLIVDDKEENLYYLRALLGGNNWEVEAARHGAEALVLARKHPPDIVVSDLLMPVMDGYTLLRYWKADPHLRKIPFVVYTATYTEAEDERLAISLGADAFLLKPAEPEEFIARLREVLANAAAAVPTPPRHQTGDEKELLKVYSETLIRKLEEKTLQLEETNRALEKDIAARKRIEESLRESEQRFRTTFEQAAVGIAHVELDGRFLRVNDKLCEITGYSREELLRQTFLDLTAPADRREGEKARRDMQEGMQKAYVAEKRYHRKDGRVIWVNIIVTVVRSDDGAPRYFMTVIGDITERKELEERFLRAQRLESIGTLAGGIAHDLNNILAPIMMGVKLLQGTVQDENSRKVVNTIGTCARRGADLVKQVLTFARGVEGDRVTVQLGQVMREIESLMMNTFPKNIVLQTSAPADLWLVTGDPTQLNQALLNFCVNARDAMPGGGSLTLTARNVEIDAQYSAMRPDIKAGRYVQLEVRDTGCGMPPEVLSRVFEPFFTTKEVGKGTGLGLSTALGVVRNHGGFVDAESTVGQGSVFRVHLPVQAGTAESALSAGAADELPRGREEMILIADDESSVREITKSTLEAFGYQVLAADDGTQAIGLYAINQDKVALVITDMMMPNMDGAALAVALHRLNPKLPIIATSGVTWDSTKTSAAAAGISQVLAKPYTAETLLRKVRTVLDGEKE